MRAFPSEKVLVTAYWRKLTRCNRAVHKSPRHVNARHITRALRMHRGHASHGEAATALGPRPRIDSNL
jgi:hypothetical protein